MAATRITFISSIKDPTANFFGDPVYQIFRNEPVEVISFGNREAINDKAGYIKSWDSDQLFGAPQVSHFIHAVSTLNLFRHKYISECYDVDIKKLKIIIPKYKSDILSYIFNRSDLDKLKVVKQIIKLALFFESLKLQDYEIKLGNLRYEKFENSFTIKYFDFCNSFFQDLDGKLSKVSAKSLSEAIKLIFQGNYLPNINENIELESLLIFDSVPLKAVDKYLEIANPKGIELIFQVCKILDDYSSDYEKDESLYLLRKVANLLLSEKLKALFN